MNGPGTGKRSTLLVVSGPSGAGKSTLCEMLLDEFSEVIRLSTSYTTRKPRGAEKDGVDYHFTTEQRFGAMIEEGAFAEWAEVHGNLYGTARNTIDGAMEAGLDLLFDIDVQGAGSVSKIYPFALTVLLLPPSMGLLERRLRGRGTDSDDVVRGRMAKARWEIEQYESFKYALVNDDLGRSYQELRRIYLADGSAVGRMREKIEALLVGGGDFYQGTL